MLVDYDRSKGGWQKTEEGRTAQGHYYVLYLYRENKNNWGDLLLKPRKDGKLVVSVAVSFNGERHKDKFETYSMAQADLLIEAWLKKYDVKNKIIMEAQDE